MKNRDYIFIFIILIICMLFFTITHILKTNGETVQVFVDSTLYRELPLDTDCTFEIENGNTLVVKDGYAYIASADCPDKLCIMQGKIKDNSKDIICLPNKVRVCITAKASTDAVSD